MTCQKGLCVNNSAAVFSPVAFYPIVFHPDDHSQQSTLAFLLSTERMRFLLKPNYSWGYWLPWFLRKLYIICIGKTGRIWPSPLQIPLQHTVPPTPYWFTASLAEGNHFPLQLSTTGFVMLPKVLYRPCWKASITFSLWVNHSRLDWQLLALFSSLWFTSSSCGDLDKNLSASSRYRQ